VNDISNPVGSASSRLIVIRGNSGSGKSAVAAGVRAGRPHGTLAVVGQDVVRRTILGTHDDKRLTAVGLIDLTARYAPNQGFDVIVEGILNAKWYGRALHRLAQDHAGVTHSYIYDLPFEETVRRHSTRAVADRFGEPEMREWWRTKPSGPAASAHLRFPTAAGPPFNTSASPVAPGPIQRAAYSRGAGASDASMRDAEVCESC
jgi:hypothetical protein